ncbi:MAG: class I SAM-dependent methyltransferase, partial [Fidelibacterota bacterium]
MMISDLRTAPVQSSSDVRAFFNRRARSYSEQHGHPQRLLEYRIRLIKKWAALGRDDVVLDIGCGNGHHLMALGGDIGRGIGIDVSEAMVKLANTRREAAGGRDNITFRVDNGEKLPTIEDESMDVAMCIGSLEHMLDQPMVVE